MHACIPRAPLGGLQLVGIEISLAVGDGALFLCLPLLLVRPSRHRRHRLARPHLPVCVCARARACGRWCVRAGGRAFACGRAACGRAGTGTSIRRAWRNSLIACISSALALVSSLSPPALLAPTVPPLPAPALMPPRYLCASSGPCDACPTRRSDHAYIMINECRFTLMHTCTCVHNTLEFCAHIYMYTHPFIHPSIHPSIHPCET